MKNLKYLWLFILVAQLSFAQTTKVNSLIIKETAQNTNTTKALVIDPVTGLVGWNTYGSGGGTIPFIDDVLRIGSTSNITNKTLRFYDDLVSGTYNKQLWISPSSLINFDPIGELTTAVFPNAFYTSSGYTGGAIPKQWGFNPNGFEFFGKNTGLEPSQFYANLLFPKVYDGDSRRIPLSVNYHFADENGNITITGSQDLQSVLTEGNTAIDQYISFTNSSSLLTYTNISSSGIGVTNNDEGYTSNLSSNNIGIQGGGSFLKLYSSVVQVEDGTKINQFTKDRIIYSKAIGRSNILDFDELAGTTASVRLRLPFDKPQGVYTLTTKDDITLQNAIEGGTDAVVDAGNSFISVFSGATNNRVIVAQVSNGNDLGIMGIQNGKITLTSYDMSTASLGAFRTENAKVKLIEQVDDAAINLVFETPTLPGNAIMTIPAKSGTIATIDDIYNIINGTFPIYANDAAADSDSALPSKALYKITGSRQLFQKP